MKTKFSKTMIASTLASLFASSTHAALPTETVANATALNQIGAPIAWARGYTGLGVKIGFVDTGADLRHADLSNVRYTYTPYAATITDVINGHGTGMISIAAGAKNNKGVMGVAYDATVLAAAGGTGGGLSKQTIDLGIRWNANQGATAINLSLGMPLSQSSFYNYYSAGSSGVYYVKNTRIINPYRDTALMPSLQYATTKGSIVVMAAGNDGNPVPTSPANLAVATNSAGSLVLGGRAVIVGAVDNYGRIASFSNRAGHICQTMVNSVCTDTVKIKDYFLVAPGGSFVWGAAANTGTSINASMGTSASTAFVTGGIAVIKQAWPTLRPEQIVQVLLKTATDLGTKGVDEIYGNGLMNLDAATRPLGTLSLAKITSVSTAAIAAGPVPVAKTTMVGGVLSKQSFASSAVLTNAQAVDEMGRNFTVDVSQGVQTNMQNYNAITAYSALSNSQINNADFNLGNVLASVYASNNITGVKLGAEPVNGIAMGIELGTALERNSLLGTYASGAFELGDSTTEWVAVNSSVLLSENSKLFASMASGTTAASAAQNSLITNFSTIKTSSWTLGIQKNQVFNKRDSLQFDVTELPHITSGYATLTGVTGFVTSNITDEGAETTPVITKETLSLHSDYRQYATSLTYLMNTGALSQISVRFTAQTDNAGSEPTASAMLNYTTRF